MRIACSGMASHLQTALQSTGMTTSPQYRVSGKLPPFFQVRNDSPTSTASLIKRKACFSSSANHHNCSASSLPLWCCSASNDSMIEVERVVPLMTTPRNDEMELPSLISSTVIPGLPPPPLQASFSVLHEAEERLKKLAERWNVQSFESWIPAGTSFTNGVYGGTSSRDRFVAIATINTVTFMLDDLLFDSPNDLVLEEFGISRSIRESPQQIKSLFKELNHHFRQHEIPLHPTPIEGIIWEMGRDIRRLSNPKWFNKFADSLMEHLEASVNNHAEHIAGDQLHMKELEAYTQMRVRNSGGQWVMTLVELACNVFLCDEFHAHSILQQLTDAAVLHCMYVNDLFSYPKEVFEEQNPRNLIKVLMGNSNHGGLGLPQAAWKVVDLINAESHVVTELEKKFDLDDFAVRTYIDGVKGVMSGNFYFHAVHKRYRHADSVFPELRLDNITNIHHIHDSIH